MARKAALYTVVFLDKDGTFDHATYGDDLAGAKDRVATYADGNARLFASEPMPFRIRRDPTVELIEAPPKKRGRRKKAPIEAAGNGAVESPVVTPPPAPRTKPTTPEA